jgi:hypothetical protein
LQRAWKHLLVAASLVDGQVMRDGLLVASAWVVLKTANSLPSRLAVGSRRPGHRPSSGRRCLHPHTSPAAELLAFEKVEK